MKITTLLASIAALAVATPALADGTLYYWTFGGGAYGHRSWNVFFGVTNHANGYVIQKIEATATLKDGSVIKLRPFWEAFKIDRGFSGDYDTFSRTNAKVKKLRVHAEARFYEGLKLPATFGHAYGSGAAPSTHVDPGLPTDGVTIVRDFEANY